jgi:hypothetical protein
MDKRYANGNGIKTRVCMKCENGAKDVSEETARKRAYVRARRAARKGHSKTYDGVLDNAIYERDEWRCRMPLCLHSSRDIDPTMETGPWRRSIDHIWPLSRGGFDTAVNKRAAHLRCNTAAGNRERSLPQEMPGQRPGRPG